MKETEHVQSQNQKRNENDTPKNGQKTTSNNVKKQIKR